MIQAWDYFGIPVLVALVSLYYYYRVTVQKDIDCVRGKLQRPLKPEAKQMYAKEAGRLILGFTAGAVGMGVLTVISPAAALVEAAAVTAAVVVLWKKLNEKYSR